MTPTQKGPGFRLWTFGVSNQVTSEPSTDHTARHDRKGFHLERMLVNSRGRAALREATVTSEHLDALCPWASRGAAHPLLLTLVPAGPNLANKLFRSLSCCAHSQFSQASKEVKPFLTVIGEPCTKNPPLEVRLRLERWTQKTLNRRIF